MKDRLYLGTTNFLNGVLITKDEGSNYWFLSFKKKNLDQWVLIAWLFFSMIVGVSLYETKAEQREFMEADLNDFKWKQLKIVVISSILEVVRASK